MLQYWTLFFLVLLILLLGGRLKFQWTLFVSLLLIFIFFAFRDGFTPDYDSYLDDFERSAGGTLSDEGRHRNEPIYQLMAIYLPYRLAIVIQTLFVCLALYVTFKYIPRKYWWFCVVILFATRSFLLGNMGALRSSFVTTFFLFALLSRYIYGLKKGTIIGALLIGISGLIHQSGWAMLPIYLLINNSPLTIRKKRVWIFVSMILVIISLFFANSINEFVNYIFKDNEELEFYRVEEINNIIQFGTFTIVYLSMLFFLLFYTIIYTGNKELTTFEINCVKLTALFFLINLLPSIALKERFYYYLAFPALIGATTIINKDKTIMGYLYCALWIMYALWNLYIFMDTANYSLIYSHYSNILF